MCATSEGREKGENGADARSGENTLPAVKGVWKSVDKLTSEAFVGMWRERVAHFYSKYMATADAESGHTSRISIEWLAGVTAPSSRASLCLFFIVPADISRWGGCSKWSRRHLNQKYVTQTSPILPTR